MNELSKYFELNCDLLNTTFNGSYQLLKYIINKYNIYSYPHPKNNKSAPQITKFATDNGYSTSSCGIWSKKDEVPPRAWNALHKDLIMLRATGKIKDDEVMTLEKLKEEFNKVNY